MLKKILVVLLILAVAGAGVFGTLHFKGKLEESETQNQILVQTNASVQASLDSIGQMTSVYQVKYNRQSGTPINVSDLMQVSVPLSSLGETSITDASVFEGNFYKIDINPGTIITTDMIMEPDDNTTKMKMTREITLDALPLGMVEGDWFDLRCMLPNGEDYVVLAHKRIIYLYGTTVTIQVSEEENQIINSLFMDIATYSSCGFFAYVTNYLEPGLDKSVAYYPVQHEIENMLRFSPNYSDISRCINPTMRDHINEVLFIFAEENSSIGAAFASLMKSQYEASVSAHQQWMQDNVNEDGDFVMPNDRWEDGTANIGIKDNNNGATSNPGSPTGSGSDSFQSTVGGAIEDLQNSLGDLEAIE